MLKNSQNLILRITPELNSALKEAASSEGKTVSFWAREAFAEKIGRDADEARVEELQRLFQELNAEGKSFVLNCAKYATTEKELKA